MTNCSITLTPTIASRTLRSCRETPTTPLLYCFHWCEPRCGRTSKWRHVNASQRCSKTPIMASSSRKLLRIFVRNLTRTTLPSSIRSEKNDQSCRQKTAKLSLVMAFPVTRLRRLRQSESMRSLVRETHLEPGNFIYPLFVCPGERVRKEISSMPGVFNLSIDEALKEAREAKSLGVGGVILFGLPEKKDEIATGAWAEDGIVQRTTRAIKQEVRELIVIGDVCLCEYMSHGHCGIVKHKTSGGKTPRVMVVARENLSAAATKVAEAAIAAEYEIENDATLDILAKTAVSQAQAEIG